jgi:hypothetical protein
MKHGQQNIKLNFLFLFGHVYEVSKNFIFEFKQWNFSLKFDNIFCDSRSFVLRRHINRLYAAIMYCRHVHAIRGSDCVMSIYIVINDLERMWKEALVAWCQVVGRLPWWDLGKPCRISGLVADVWTRGLQIQSRVGHTQPQNFLNFQFYDSFSELTSFCGLYHQYSLSWICAVYTVLRVYTYTYTVCI